MQSPTVGGAFIGRWGEDPRRKSSAGEGGLEGWPVRWQTGGGEWFWGGRGGVAARAGRLAAQGVEFDDKLEALDFVSNGWKI